MRGVFAIPCHHDSTDQDKAVYHMFAIPFFSFGFLFILATQITMIWGGCSFLYLFTLFIFLLNYTSIKLFTVVIVVVVPVNVNGVAVTSIFIITVIFLLFVCHASFCGMKCFFPSKICLLCV